MGLRAAPGCCAPTACCRPPGCCALGGCRGPTGRCVLDGCGPAPGPPGPDRLDPFDLGSSETGTPNASRNRTPPAAGTRKSWLVLAAPWNHAAIRTMRPFNEAPSSVTRPLESLVALANTVPGPGPSAVRSSTTTPASPAVIRSWTTRTTMLPLGNAVSGRARPAIMARGACPPAIVLPTCAARRDARPAPGAPVGVARTKSRPNRQGPSRTNVKTVAPTRPEMKRRDHQRPTPARRAQGQPCSRTSFMARLLAGAEQTPDDADHIAS